MGTRIHERFKALNKEGRAAFVPFIMAGDPDYDTALALMKGLPGAGADIIELGMPFTDPMADGPAIQLAGQRALNAKMTLSRVLAMVQEFRRTDQKTPIVLMGYYNPIFTRGTKAFISEAKSVGVDGLIVVDLPPEEDEELCLPARAAELDFIRLATPTTDAQRAPVVLGNSSGFVYYVSITGITGAAAAQANIVAPAVDQLRKARGLPVCVGFGVRTPQNAAEIAKVADGVVAGSAIVDTLNATGSVDETLAFVTSLAEGVRSARRT